jgi:hypothetical protein
MAKTTPGTAVAKAKINLPVDVNAAMAAEVALIQSRIGSPSGNRITVTQGKTFKLPDGLEVEETLQCVVVEFSSTNLYYTDAFDRNNIVPPACFALGMEPSTLIPDKNAPEPQAGSCASCWANQFGSSGKGKACQNTRQLAVLPLDATAETPLWLLKVSPTALRAFDGYVATVARKHGVPVRAMVTEISFSEDQYASLRFNEVGGAEKSLVMMAQMRKDEAQKLLLTPPAVAVPGNEAPDKKPPVKSATKASTKRPTAPR